MFMSAEVSSSSNNNNSSTRHSSSSSPDYFRDNHYDPNHPRSSKRRCSYNSVATATSSACTTTEEGGGGGDAMMDIISTEPAAATTGTTTSNDCYDEVQAAATPPLRNDWFHDIPTLSKKQPTTTAYYNHQQQQQMMLSCELQSLEHQLTQVKHRFGPAAERCAQAVCSSNTFSTTASHEFELARRACNPYEILGETRPGGLNHGLFLNRSAIKLANMDALLNFGLTLTFGTSQSQQQQQQQAFHFADLCAAPGGFSEYLLRRYCHTLQQQQQLSNLNSGGGATYCCRGYGMSLVGNNDQGHGTPWKLSQGPLLMGHGNNHGGVYYHICHGEDGTGDIFQWHNVQALQREIAAQQLEQHAVVRGKVALVTADGGVDAQRNCEHQDAQTQKLVVCQVAAAMSILQLGGRFIIKLFGCQTPVLQTVMQELYNSFDTLQFLKPVSSRPASGERYLVCTGFQGVSCSSSIMSDPQHPVFYGPKWINKVLMGQGPIDPTLQAFLMRVDRDMMQLNLKACFAILSCMESKTMRLSNGNYTMINNGHHGQGNAMDDEDDLDEHFIQQGYHNYHQQQPIKKLDVEHYRMAWRLF